MPLPSSPRTVVTGAGGGFGRAIALEIARRRGRLVLGDLDLEQCEQTAHLAMCDGAIQARAFRCDVTKLADVEALAAACPDGIDLLVNNAGVSSAGPIGTLPIDDWRWTLDVDLWGVIHGCHVFIPLMRKQGCGHVLNVAAAAAMISAPLMGAYNVAKAGVVSLSETLAAELAGSEIGVTVACPTFFRSDIVAKGRFEDENTRKLAQRLMNKGGSSQTVARKVIQAVERGDFYCLPMLDAKLLWWAKRMAPNALRRAIMLWTRFAQR